MVVSLLWSLTACDALFVGVLSDVDDSMLVMDEDSLA